MTVLRALQLTIVVFTLWCLVTTTLAVLVGDFDQLIQVGKVGDVLTPTEPSRQEQQGSLAL